MRSWAGLAAWVLAMGVAVGGCRPKRADDSELLHASSTPTRGGEPWMWETVTRAEFKDVLLPYWSIPAEKIAPANAKLTNRVEFWVDAFDAALREHVKKKRGAAYYEKNLAHVPKPQVAVVSDKEANAFVPSIPVCYEVEVQFPRRAGQRAEKLPRVRLSSYDTIGVEVGAKHCLKRSIDKAGLTAMMKWFNANHPSCKIEVGSEAGKPVLVLGDGCPVDADAERYAGASTFTWETAANWIVVNTGLITFFRKEPEILGTLAHELGHYYRSHMTAYHGEYYYFYALTDAPVDAKPKAAAEMQDDGAVAKQSSRLLQLWTVHGQKIPAAIFRETGKIVRRQCDMTGAACHAACRAAVAALDANPKVFTPYPEDPLPEGGLLVFRAYEEQVVACAETIAVQEAHANGVVTYKRLRQMLEAAQAERVFLADVSRVRTLGEALKVWSEEVQPAKSRARNKLKTFDRRGLGYYTPEQDADELGMELVTLLGYDPEVVVEGAFILYAGSRNPDEQEADTLSGGWAMAKCKAARLAGWQEEGEAVIPPVADFFGDHHANCFRVWNLTREIVAHGYAAGAAPLAPPASPTWNEIRSAAAALH